MGFLRRLFGGGKKHHHPQPPPGTHDGSGQKPGKEKRNWSFVKQSTRDKSNNSNNRRYDPSSAADSLDANKHAIAVAAATAAVAEAALAAAHAAAQVVRLTGGGRPATAAEVQRMLAEEIAAVKIQSAFRGYLARRALRALKALVKLQSLVRGHIVRKKTADMLKRMQTLVRLQARARAGRVHLSDNNNMPSFNSSLSHYPVPEDYEHPLRAYSTKFDGSSVLKRCTSNSNYRDIGLERTRFGSSWREESGWSQTGNNASLRNGHIIDDEKSDKILEVDTWKPHLSSHHHHNVNHNNIVAYDQSPLKHSSKGLNPRTAENSPQAFSASYRLGSSARKGGPFTPTKSECSWGFFNGYSSHPNYMANTESSRAKVRSHSAPRQRLEFDRYGSNRRFVQGLWDAGPNLSSSHLNRVGSTKLR